MSDRYYVVELNGVYGDQFAGKHLMKEFNTLLGAQRYCTRLFGEQLDRVLQIKEITSVAYDQATTKVVSIPSIRRRANKRWVNFE